MLRHIMVYVVDEKTSDFLYMHHIELEPTGDDKHDATHAIGEAAEHIGLTEYDRAGGNSHERNGG
jgi:hypothetical protein